MRRSIFLFLVALAAAGEKDFELSPPAGDEWEALKPGDGVRAHFKTEFADSDPRAVAEVRVMTYPLSAALEAKGLDAIARDWAATVEAPFKEPRSVEEGASDVGGEKAWRRDVRTDSARLTWHVARKGKVLYVFHVIRTGKATDDARVEEEVAAMRARLRFPDERPEALPPEPPRVEKEPRATLSFDHWRFECVKPEGLANVPPEQLEKAERESGVVAKFTGKGEQTSILVRIHARSRVSQRFTIEELAAQKVKQFEEAYAEGSREAPRRDAWKCPLAERGTRLELVGRKATVQTRLWYLAQCRNGRQYQIEILVTGGGADWEDGIRELVEGFRPQR